MPLISCPECGKEFSAQARACPNCGRPFGTSNILQKELGMDGWLIGMVMAGAFALGLLGFWWAWIVFGAGFILILIKLIK